jgi:predicted SprT family Zn-dependent metalloprotease
VKFSTKVIEKMAEILSEELSGYSEELGESGGVMAIEEEMRQVLREVGARGLGQVLSKQDERKERKRKLVCECGKQAVYQRRRKAVVVSVFGRVGYRRSYYLCAHCHQGQVPLDRELHLSPGAVTAGLGSLLALAGVEASFEEGRRKIQRYLGIEVSDNTIRKETELFGRLQAAEEQAWKDKSQDVGYLQERVRQAIKRQERIYGSIDGVMTPLKGEWRELKVVSWYEAERVMRSKPRRHHGKRSGQQVEEMQTKNISYATDQQDAESFAHLVWATGCQREAERYAEIVFIADGAAWIWRLVEQYYPNAIQIVDWYHACAYLAPIAKAAFADNPQAENDWLEATREDLWQGRIQAVLAACRAVEGLAPEPARKAISYYTNNEKRMKYAHLRQQGYLIGSGTVESACKQIALLRLCCAGARWSKDGLLQTAKARAAWLSDAWDTLSARRALLPLAI